MNIIFDLDGTLIDSSERMYQLFQTLVPQSLLTKSEYLELKRDKISHKMILEKYFPDVLFEDFNLKWMQEIEKEKYILLDQNYSDTIYILDKLSKKYDLFLLTSRQSKDILIKQLIRLKLEKYFVDFLVTKGECTKKELLHKYDNYYFGFLDRVKYYVSDMGEDILIGNELQLTTIAITHGLMNEVKLNESQPKYIISTLLELMKLDY